MGERLKGVFVRSVVVRLGGQLNCVFWGFNCGRWQRQGNDLLNFQEARNNLKRVLDHVIDDADYTVITRRDAADAVIMSLDYFNSLLETVHLLRAPANAAHLARSIEQHRSGQSTGREMVDEANTNE